MAIACSATATSITARTVEAYWLVRQRAAECQVAAEQAGLLATIEPVVLERRNQPSGAADMLRLQTAQLAAKATMDDSRVAKIEAQYALAPRIGALADAAWPLASTLPHTGDYDLKLEVQPVSLRKSWPVERLAAMVPGLKQSVQERAAAVVDADDARVSAIDRYAHGGVAIDQAIEGVDEQTKQTLRSWARFRHTTARSLSMRRPCFARTFPPTSWQPRLCQDHKPTTGQIAPSESSMQNQASPVQVREISLVDPKTSNRLEGLVFTGPGREVSRCLQISIRSTYVVASPGVDVSREILSYRAPHSARIGASRGRTRLA